MAKRGRNARNEHGRWDIGGGSIEFGDTAEETLRKEIREEYGTDVLDFEFLGYRDVLLESGGQPTHWLALDFKVHVDPEKVKNGEPHIFDDIGWFTFDTIPEQAHSQLPKFLDLYRERLGV